MFGLNTSPAESESSSASNNDDTSSSTQTTVRSHHRDFAYRQPPKSSAKDFADQAQSHRDESPTPSVEEECSEEEYSNDLDPWPKPKPGYTRRLIPMVRISLEEIDDTFDEDAFIKQAYQNVEIVDMCNVPKGWVLVNGITPV